MKLKTEMLKKVNPGLFTYFSNIGIKVSILDLESSPFLLPNLSENILIQSQK